MGEWQKDIPKIDGYYWWRDLDEEMPLQPQYADDLARCIHAGHLGRGESMGEWYSERIPEPPHGHADQPSVEAK